MLFTIDTFVLFSASNMPIFKHRHTLIYYFLANAEKSQLLTISLNLWYWEVQLLTISLTLWYWEVQLLTISLILWYWEVQSHPLIQGSSLSNLLVWIHVVPNKLWQMQTRRNSFIINNNYHYYDQNNHDNYHYNINHTCLNQGRCCNSG